MSLTRFAVRTMLSSIFVTGGLNAAKNADALAPAVDGLLGVLPSQITDSLPELDSATLAKLNGITMVAAGGGLALGVMPRLNAAILAAQLVPTTLAGHRFWELEGQERADQQISFTKNVAIAGGLLAIALGGATKAPKIKKAK